MAKNKNRMAPLRKQYEDNVDAIHTFVGKISKAALAIRENTKDGVPPTEQQAQKLLNMCAQAAEVFGGGGGGNQEPPPEE